MLFTKIVNIKKDIGERYKMQFRAYRMRLKKEHLKDYIKVHKKEKIWKSVVEDMVKAGFKKMIILQSGQDLILFEEAEDLKTAYSYYGKAPESQRWDDMISEWMEIYPEFNGISGEIVFDEIPVIFYYQDGRLLH